MNKVRAFGNVCYFISLLCFLVVSPALDTARAESAASPPRTAAQLEQLVAPIALYPDSLISQILMASTYPLEVIEAARWVQGNPGVTGQALEDAMQKQQWDPSVKSLTAIPQTLQMMNDKLAWTQQIGDAFLAQQADVLDAVQRLRERADSTGTLKTTEQQKVTKTSVAQAPEGTSRSADAPAYVYTIESTSPDTYYLPIYDPMEAYGAWPYAGYEPFYWYPPGYFGGNVLTFAAGAFVGAAIWGNVDWWRRNVTINPLRYNQFNRTNIASNTWNHNPAHRGSVPYRDQGVAQRFGDQSKAGAREAFRGKADAGRRDLAKQGGASKVADRKADGSSAKGSKEAAGKGKASREAAGKGKGSKQAAGKGKGSKQAAGGRATVGAE